MREKLILKREWETWDTCTIMYVMSLLNNLLFDDSLLPLLFVELSQFSLHDAFNNKLSWCELQWNKCAGTLDALFGYTFDPGSV